MCVATIVCGFTEDFLLWFTYPSCTMYCCDLCPLQEALHSDYTSLGYRALCRWDWSVIYMCH